MPKAPSFTLGGNSKDIPLINPDSDGYTLHIINEFDAITNNTIYILSDDGTAASVAFGEEILIKGFSFNMSFFSIDTNTMTINSSIFNKSLTIDDKEFYAPDIPSIEGYIILNENINVEINNQGYFIGSNSYDEEITETNGITYSNRVANWLYSLISFNISQDSILEIN